MIRNSSRNRTLLKLIALLTALVLIAGGCGGSKLDHEQVAADLGAELALRLTEPILRASTAGTGTESARAIQTLEESLIEATGALGMPEGVSDVVVGSRANFSATSGYAAVSAALTVVPEEDEPLFCMVFAMGSDGTVVAEPAPGEPVNRCSDTDLVSPLRP